MQLVHRLEVEGETAVRTVDLDPHGVLAPGRESGRFERRDGTTVRAAEEDRGVVNRDIAVLDGTRATRAAGRGGAGKERTSLYEGLEESRDTDEALAREEAGQIDDMSADVAECA